MKITAIDARIERFELTRPYTIAFRSIDTVENGIVRIETDRASIGLGAASPEPFVTGESNEAMAAALEPARLEWLIGNDVRELPRLCRELARRMNETPAARAAIDMALHDLLAQRLDCPLVQMLGRAHTRLPTSITIGIKSVSETLEEAREYLARGFKVLKIKLGQSLAEDVERLVRLRELTGASVALRVDPNQGYSAQQVRAFVDQTQSLDIEFIEQPMSARNVQAMRELPEAVRVRLAADETLLSESDALTLVQPPRACGIFNIKLMKCGGIHAARRIADLAEVSGVDLMWGCMDESIISISAALHAALASPATRYLDLDGSLDLARDVVEGGFVLDDGELATTNAPGLGLRVL